MENKKIWSKLPKKDKKHLRENKILYKWQFEEQIKHIKKLQNEGEYPMFVCYDCITIAKKLGMWN
jgi:hypothetical protein